MEKIEQKQKSVFNIIIKIAIIFFIYASFLTPLIAFPDFFIFGFITPKAWFFRSLVLCASFLFIFLIAVSRKKIYFSKIHKSLFVFLFVITITSLFGCDFHASLWSNEERMWGIITLIHFFIFCALLSNVFSDKANSNFLSWRLVFWFNAVVALAVSIIAIAQRFDKSILYIVDSSRIFGTLGNPIFFGHYCALSIILSVLLFIKEQKILLRAMLFFIICVQFIAFLLADSRGAILGLFFGIVFSVFVGFFLIQDIRAKKKFFVYFGILILLLVLCFPQIQKILTKYNIATRITNGFIMQSEERPLAWKVSYQAWKLKPFFGFGQENFRIAFDAFVGSKNNGYDRIRSRWFDNAHNTYINQLVENGIFGLFAYFAVYLFAFIAILKDIKKNKKESVVLLFFLITDLAIKMFKSEDASPFLLLMIVFAYIASKKREHDLIIDAKKINNPQKIFFAILVFSAIWIVYNLNFIHAKQSNYRYEMFRIISNNPNMSLYAFRETINIKSVYEKEIILDLSDVFLDEYDKIAVNVSIFEFEQIKKELTTALERIIAKYPNDARLYVRLIEIAGKTEYISVDYIDSKYEQVLLISPNRTQLYQVYSDALAQKKQTEKALIIVDKAIEENKYTKELYLLKAKILYLADLKKEAGEYIVEAIKKNLVSAENIKSASLIAKCLFYDNVPNPIYDLWIIDYYEKKNLIIERDVFIRLIEQFDRIGLYGDRESQTAKLSELYPQFASENKRYGNNKLNTEKKLLDLYYGDEDFPLYVYHAILYMSYVEPENKELKVASENFLGMSEKMREDAKCIESAYFEDALFRDVLSTCDLLNLSRQWNYSNYGY